MKLQRQKRKTAKLSYAMAVLDESRTTINRRIDRGELKVVPGEGKTSPKRVYVAEVESLAARLGRV